MLSTIRILAKWICEATLLTLNGVVLHQGDKEKYKILILSSISGMANIRHRKSPLVKDNLFFVI